MSGFSISNNLMANEVNLELSEHQQSLGISVRDLSSGLRVNTAADDPSGNAIATSLQSHAQAFNQASQNVTNAQNAGAVADGALAAVTDILLRIRELAVGAASAVDSTSDRVNIQSEVDQLLLEINRIAQNTNFNGRTLLDGSIAGYQPAQDATATITANTVLLGASTASTTGDMLVANAEVSTQRPIVYTMITNAVTASSVAQTVTVSNIQGLESGDVLVPAGYNGATISVVSVNAMNDTMTAIFSQPLSSGQQLRDDVNADTLNAIAAGANQVVHLSGTAQPLYVGEQLQLPYSSQGPNEVVTVKHVLGPTTFVADFQYAHSAGAYIGSSHFDFIGGPVGPGPATIAYGTNSNPSPPGTPVTLLDNSNPLYSTQQGVVVADGTTNYTLDLPQAYPNGVYALAPVGFAAVSDGTIALQVVQSSGAVALQETFYDTATQTATISQTLMAPGAVMTLFDGVTITAGSFTLADVGSTAYVKVLQYVPPSFKTNNPALHVQSGADEGDLIQIAIPAVNTNTLRVSAVTVIGASGSDPTLASEDAIGQCDFALGQVTTLRAQIGAEVVRLGVDETNDETAATALTASQSNITDLNAGPATTEFTEQQIDIDVATSILTQVNNLHSDILRLFQPQPPA